MICGGLSEWVELVPGMHVHSDLLICGRRPDCLCGQRYLLDWRCVCVCVCVCLRSNRFLGSSGEPLNDMARSSQTMAVTVRVKRLNNALHHRQNTVVLRPRS